MTSRILDPTGNEWPVAFGDEGVQPPKRLFARGLAMDPNKIRVAVVGTRRPTATGIETARKISTGLAEAGIEVVSGLAVGIDAVAHRAALIAGGRTVAVLGCGLDFPYPKTNLRLKESILCSGTALSEYEDGTQPMPYHFPERNRVIAALSKGIVVIEGRRSSGALITARVGFDFNRDVFALPGSIRNLMAEGPNELIKTNIGHLITGVGDILDRLAPELAGMSSIPLHSPDFFRCSEEEAEVLRLLDDAPTTPDWLLRNLGLQPGALGVSLAKLEIRGLIRRGPRGVSITESGARARASLVDTEQ